MNIIHHSDTFQKTAQPICQVVGFLLTAGLAVVLIVTWILVEPVFQLIEKAAHREKYDKQASNRDAICAGVGMVLLILGILMIIYGFNAPDSVNLDVQSAFAGAPTGKTLGLLLGGSASVVVGVTLATYDSENV